MHKYIVRIPVLGYLEWENVQAGTPEEAIEKCMAEEWSVQDTLNLDKYMEVEPYRASAYPMIESPDGQQIPEQMPDGTPINAFLGGLRVIESNYPEEATSTEKVPFGTFDPLSSTEKEVEALNKAFDNPHHGHTYADPDMPDN